MENITINQQRSERIGQAIERAHSQIQAVLIEQGLDSTTARFISATRLFYLLPPQIQSAILTIEEDIAPRLETIIRDIAKSDVKGLKDTPIE